MKIFKKNFKNSKFLFVKILHKLSTKDIVVYSSVYTISKPKSRFIEELPKRGAGFLCNLKQIPSFCIIRQVFFDSWHVLNFLST